MSNQSAKQQPAAKPLPKQNPSKGYLVVASNKRNFYLFAINLIETIKDFDPDAKCCLATEQRFVDGRASVADDLLICDNHYRAKLWAMANTPYDITFYIDADCEVVHEDITTVFDQLGDNDMVFTELTKDREYIFVETSFPGGRLNLCGGVCLYDMRNPLVRDFMQDWWDYYCKQYAQTWWPTNNNGDPDYAVYPKSLRAWDQFTLWWLTEKEEKYKDIKVGIFEDDARWNYYVLLDEAKGHAKDEPIILHYSSHCNKDDTVY